MKKECNTVSFKNQVIYVGIDIHKNSWQVSIRHCRHQLANFSMNPDALKLAEHLRRNYPEAEYRSVYEAGFCGFEIHRSLCGLGILNIVINPADVPTSGKERANKNDGLDSRKLARELENGSLEGIYIPQEDNLVLRNLTRRETQLTGNITRVKNRIKSHLYFNGLKFRSWAGSSLKIMEADAVKRHDFALCSLLRELRFLRLEKLQVVRDEKECLKFLNREKTQVNLQSIPGIGFRTAVVLQSELWDLKRFPDKDHLKSYVGLAPRLVGSGEHEEVKSAGNRKKKQLHYLLIESAWRAVRFNLEYRARYGLQIAKGTNPQRAITIIAKKLLMSIHAQFIETQQYVTAATDFAQVERLTPFGLVRESLLFFMDIGSREVCLGGIVHNPDSNWTTQIARNMCDMWDGFMLGKKYLIHDRDPLFNKRFDSVFESIGVQIKRLPPFTPQMNARMENFIRAIKTECLNKIIFTSERQLRLAVKEYLEYWNHYRFHAGLGGKMVKPYPQDMNAPVREVSFLGGLLHGYRREPMAA